MSVAVRDGRTSMVRLDAIWSLLRWSLKRRDWAARILYASFARLDLEIGVVLLGFSSAIEIHYNGQPPQLGRDLMLEVLDGTDFEDIFLSTQTRKVNRKKYSSKGICVNLKRNK